MATKTSKATIEGMLDELREILPAAEDWHILRNVDNGYGMYKRGEGDTLHLLLNLGDSAPEAAMCLNGVIFAIRTLR